MRKGGEDGGRIMKKRIMSYFVSLTAAAITLTMVIMVWLTYNMFETRVVEDLSIDARVLASLVMTEEAEQVYDGLRDSLRVTIIGGDGGVLYDNAADVREMDDHSDRPEIEQAIKDGEGRDVRQSRTVDRSTFYYALLLEDGRVMRVAKEASSVWSVYMRALPLILILALTMIGMGALGAGKLTGRLMEPIVRMTEDLSDVSGVARYPELEPFMSKIEMQHDEILRSANMRVEFTANVSHELKTPLTSITGYAELIESGMAQGEMVKRFAGEIHKSASRLLTLINDIIRLSQMDTAELQMETEAVDLGAVAESVAEQLRMNAQRLQVELKTDIRPAQIIADRGMIEELVYNLCDNAIRYNVRGGSVNVEVRPVRERVLLVVQDTGIGISKENQAHVFERFYRVDKSRSKATGGTGLGLAIVKHIAARHGASIGMESELGSGTTITVSFEKGSGHERK